MKFTRSLLIVLLILTACSLDNNESNSSRDESSARVVHIRDGDTIEVEIDGEVYAVRYIGINTPESDQSCFQDATEANRRMVEGQIVSLEKDVSDTDQYGRLLRYVYVGDAFVNAELVRQGWAESSKWEPDTRYFENFRSLEQQAQAANLGCHPTGIFDDGSYER